MYKALSSNPSATYTQKNRKQKIACHITTLDLRNNMACSSPGFLFALYILSWVLEKLPKMPKGTDQKSRNKIHLSLGKGEERGSLARQKTRRQ
jgi:hypothetical protein